MSVAIATSQAPSALAFMTARNGYSVVDDGADTTAVASNGSTTTSSSGVSGARYPIIGFKYDTDASRLVMLYRNPDTGDTVTQIPTEVALRQYEEQQQKEKKASQRQLLHIVEGGGTETGSGTTAGGAKTGATAKTTSVTTAKAPTLNVVSSTTTASTSVSDSTPPSPTSTGGVNIVV